MLIDELPRSFLKKNNSYSHCPLKKRPVTVVLSEELPKTEIKEESLDSDEHIVVDDCSEPENLSTKPEDLSRNAEKRSRSPVPGPPSVHHHHHHPRHSHNQDLQRSSPQYQPLFPSKAITPPAAVAPIHPVAKRARVEILQHDCPTVTSASAAVAGAPALPIPHFLGSAVAEPLSPGYASPGWTRAGPLYAASHHYLSYPGSAFRPQHPHLPELYPAYPVPAYHQQFSSPEHRPVSPPPSLAQQPLVQRPVPRTYAQHWAAATSAPEHCGLSPTHSLRSPPPPISPEDLSSPGSESGRSSAGSVSVGPVGQPAPRTTTATTTTTAEPKVPQGAGGSPRYQCPNCAKSYSTYSGLSKHQQFHCAAADGQPKKTFSCKYCEKLYMTLGALKMHIRTHTLPCKCHLCGKAFSRPWLLQGHIRTHTGEKPFSCQHCQRAFADRSNLRAHLQTHSDVKKYSCPACHKTFSRMSLLSKHQEGGCPAQTQGAAMLPGHQVPLPYAC